MQAAVYRGVNDVRLETVPVPAIGPRELLVRVHSCGVCGTDLKKISTGSHSAPRIFGHETSGVVAAVGEGVSDFRPGDRVIAYMIEAPAALVFYADHPVEQAGDPAALRRLLCGPGRVFVVARREDLAAAPGLPRGLEPVAADGIYVAEMKPPAEACGGGS